MKIDPLAVILSKTHSISHIQNLLEIILIFIIFHFKQGFIITIHPPLTTGSHNFIMHSHQHLKQQFYRLFIDRNNTLLTQRHIYTLTADSYYSVDEIFQARYDDVFIENISTKNVFIKVLEALENIVSAQNKIKFSSKNKPNLILKNDTYLKTYIRLLFSNNQKKMLNKLVQDNFSMNNGNPPNQQKVGQSDTESQSNGIEALIYILSNIFSLESPKKPVQYDNAQSTNSLVSTLHQSIDPSFDL